MPENQNGHQTTLKCLVLSHQMSSGFGMPYIPRHWQGSFGFFLFSRLGEVDGRTKFEARVRTSEQTTGKAGGPERASSFHSLSLAVNLSEPVRYIGSYDAMAFLQFTPASVGLQTIPALGLPTTKEY